MGVRRGAGGCRPPPLESELSFIRIGFSPIDDVRTRGSPPLKKFLVTPMATLIVLYTYLEFLAFSKGRGLRTKIL